MSDEVDQANDNISHNEKIAISSAALYKGPLPTGVCLSPDCSEQVPDHARWCDSDCRDAWQKFRSRYNRD